MRGDELALVVTPHPMTTQGQRVYDAVAAELVPGETLAVFLDRHGVQAGGQWVVSLGGIEVHELMWDRVRPKPGHLIEARRVAHRDVLALVATVALGYFTFGLGGMAGAGASGLWGTGLTGAAGWIAAGVTYLAGAMVINKLLGPKPLEDVQRAQNLVSPTYSLSGGRNQARAFEPMPLVLGQPYCVPDLAAQPYNTFVGEYQYLLQILHAGLNCASLSNLRIGQSDLSYYQGVSLSYDGFGSSTPGVLAVWAALDTVAGGLLDAPSGWGPQVVRTSSINTSGLAVDIEGSLYSVNQTNGAYENLSVDIGIYYREVGSGTWLPFLTAGAILTIVSGTTKPLRLTYSRGVPAGQWEVMMQKVTANVTAANQTNVVQWTALKSYQMDYGDYAGQSRVGLKIQASGQLNGGLNEVNWVATMMPCPYWDGSAWVTATTRANGLSNPGALILLLARGVYDYNGRLIAGLGFADSQIDIESLKLFMVRCAAKGFTFDYFLQETTSIGDLLNAIAAAGMGSISWHPGTLSVIWFSESDPVESVLNMGAMKAKSFSVDYATQATADEIEFQYFDRDRGYSWKSVRVLAPAVISPTNTARQKLVGVTSEAHAAVLARFSMAQNIYQRKTVTCEVDLEHMTFRRGTVVALSHDVTQWGYGGRVKAAVNVSGTVTLTLDDVVPAVSPSGATSRYIGLRLAGETQYRIFPIASFVGTSRNVTLATAWPGGVAVPGDSAGNPAWDALWIYDFKATPGQKMRVADITPQGNLGGARVSLVPESDEFWSFVWTGAYTPPPNTSLLLQTAPVVTDAVVTEMLKRQGNTFYTELTVTFAVTGRYDQTELWGAIGAGQKRLLDSTRGLRLSWQGGLSETWELELRPYSDIHVGAPYSLSYDVVGVAEPPPPFDIFTVFAQPDGTRQYNFGYLTHEAQPVDWLGAEIRYVAGTVPLPDWDSMTLLQDLTTYYTSSPVELNAPLSGVYTFACKSIDTTGNESSYLVRTVALPERRKGDVFEEYFEHLEGWTGTKTGCHVRGSTLEADDTVTWDTLPATWDDWTQWSTNPTSPITYETPVRDLGTVVAGQINGVVDADGVVLQEIATSADGTTWSAWGSVVASFSTRYLKLRMTVTATLLDKVPAVRVWTYQINAPVKREYINDVVIASLTGAYRIGTGDVRIPLTGSYTVLKRTDVVVQDNSAGTWTYARIDQSLSPAPRWQFRLNGTLADPAYVDFFIEGY